MTEVMTFFTDLHSRVAAISGFFPGAVTVEELGALVRALDAAQVVALMKLATEARHALEQVTLATSAVVQARSSREAGHSGLAQSLGCRTPAALIQQVTGVSRGAAMQQIRVGEALMHTTTLVETLTEGDDGVPIVAQVPQVPWHEPLTAALRTGTLSSAQHDAIRQGLGEPPASVTETSDPFGSPDTLPADAASAAAAPATADPATIEAWSLAATQLAGYAAEVSAEELAKQARLIRDLLDPDGAHVRFLVRYERRSFRMWTDSDGLTHGKFVFDDEAAEWVRTIIDTTLRPRRGGPRFVTVEEQAAAQKLNNDPRTNDQLTHDLLLDVLRSGAVADVKTVFGVKQAGIKLVQVVNRDDYLASERTGAGTSTKESTSTVAGAGVMADATTGAGLRPPITKFQESGITLPSGMGEKHRCNTGTQPVIIDEAGDPLNVGREERLFTPTQRVALAIRDGGCRRVGCDRPPSYCETHHIDHWDEDHGRTDIDRGVLLCRFHHMQLHNNKWKITRDALGPFLLHPPPRPTATPASPHIGANTEAAMKAEPCKIGPAGARVWAPEKPDLVDEGRSAPWPDWQYEEGSSWQAEPAKQAEQATLGEPEEPIELRPPLPLNYAWQLATPPVKRASTAA